MNKPRHLTIVYTINDEESFKDEREKIFNSMKESKGEPWAITAMSMDHEMQRLHWIEKALEDGDLDAVDAVISAMDIGNIESLEDLRV